MKKMFIITVILMGCLLTACSTKIPLDDPNTDVVAEYVAELLLHYGSDTPEKLVYTEPTPKATASPYVEATPTPSLAGTTSPKGEPVATVTPSKPSDQPTTSNKPGKDTNDRLTANTTPVSLDAIYGYKDVKVSLKSFKEYSSYPEIVSAYCITARKGYKLLIITLSAQNNGKDSVDINLGKKGITYNLFTGKRWCSSLITILDNDAQYLRTTLKAGKTKDFLVAFEVEEGVNLNDASLVLLQDIKSCELMLK